MVISPRKTCHTTKRIALCSVRIDYFSDVTAICVLKTHTVTSFFVTVRKYHLVRLRASPQPCRKKFVTVQDEIRNRMEKNSRPYAFWNAKKQTPKIKLQKKRYTLVCNMLILIVLFLIVLLFYLLFEKRVRLQIICPRLQNNFQP